MNYLQEIISFERWLETNHLPKEAQLLWYRLMYTFNKAGWCEWVTVDNQRLMGLIGVNREKTFIDIRAKLIEEKLISYIKGKKNSPSKYKLNSVSNKLTFKYEVQTEVQTEDIYKHKQNNITPIGVIPRQINYKNIVDMYNSICVSLPKVKLLTDSRKDKIKVRYRQLGSDDKFREVFVIVESSDFLKGNNKNNWKASFDWLIENDKNMVKVLEGNYDKYTVDKSGDGYSYNAFDEYNLKG